MENKLAPKEINKALSMRLEPSSPAMKAWIAAELGALATRWDRPLTPARLKAYAEDLQAYPQYRLRTAFQRLKTEWHAEDFGFPLLADILDRLDPVSERSDDWKGPTKAEKQQREAQREEAAGWWKALKGNLKTLTATKRINGALKPMSRPQMTDAEEEYRRLELKRQAELMKEKYGS